jgi:FKBP-type peptidyl-prolyl cis-trans isomerase FkpA
MQYHADFDLEVINMKFHFSIALIAVCFTASFSTHLHAQTTPATPASATPITTPNAPAPLHITSLGKIDTEVGTGAEAVYGSQVEVHYTGWLYDPKAPNLHGAKFDSSRTSGTPFTFQVGGRQVIKGWDLGVVGMKVGGKRTLMIPSYLGYSTAGSGAIPPNTHLVFDIELLSVK